MFDAPPKTAALLPLGEQPTLSYGAVIDVVRAAADLTPGVRSNIVSAVERVAALMSAAGLSQMVDIPGLADRLTTVVPAKIGMKSKQSLSALISNFHRGLRLAGFIVMPGRHATTLTPEWRAQCELLDEGARRDLSRLAHVASEQGWDPGDISDAHVDRFEQIVRTTCNKSKADKVLRQTTRQWEAARTTVAGWQGHALTNRGNSNWYYGLPWQTFPESFRADVDTYLSRGFSLVDDDWLEAPVDILPIATRTQVNYRGALLRAASILVGQGIEAGSINGIADLVAPARVKQILLFLKNRTKRKDGGHVGFVALVLYIASRDWVHRVPKGDKLPEDVSTLQKYFENAKSKHNQMSDKTWERLQQFEDPHLLARFFNLPTDLVREAKRRKLDAESAATVRLALFIALLIDTGLRPGDVVELDLAAHVRPHGNGARRKIELQVPGLDIKNGVAFEGELRRGTVEIFDLYISGFREFHMAGTSSTWLFPRSNGTFWPEGAAYSAFNDACGWRLGADVNPHLVRALIGKLILDHNPGAILDVKETLGHRSIATSAAFYIKLRPADARRRYHEILDGKDRPSRRC